MILILSAALNGCNITFPLGYHYDEPKKVVFILSGRQDFHHPILMLQLARAANAILHLRDDYQVAVLGRIITASCGVLVTLVTYIVARSLMSAAFSCMAALFSAVTPLMVIHSHYLKEDVLLTLTALLTLHCFFRHLHLRSTNSAIYFGIALGLALAAHYKAVLLIFLLIVAPLFCSIPRLARFYASMAKALLVALALFAAINAPLFVEFSNFISGIRHEARHVVQGHTVRVLPVEHAFCFHLRNSLVPGMGIPLVAIGLIGMGVIGTRWRRESMQRRVLSVYVCAFYLIVEVAPLKPDPNFERYIIPIVPVLAIIAAGTLADMWYVYEHYLSRGIVVVAACAGALCAGIDAVLLDYHIGSDTRQAAEKYVIETESNAMCESHSSRHLSSSNASDWDIDMLLAMDVDLIVTSSFAYDRFFRGTRLRAKQDPSVYWRKRRYEELFTRYNYIEFSPTYRSFAFFNPTIRVIRIDSGNKVGG